MIPRTLPAPLRFRFSTRVQGLAPSVVREILKVAEKPEIISFAGGLPAPELFPTAELAAAFADVISRDGGAALQYGITEGYEPLRDFIAASLRRRGVEAIAERVLVTNGSQQGIDLVSRVLLDPGDVVLVENPTYLAALQAFAACGANVVAVPSDDHGVLVHELRAALALHRPALVYLVPEFQNPKGTSLALERRLEVARAVEERGVPLLEDDPYSALRFRGDSPPPLAALTKNAIHLGTFSKTLAPGLRLGFAHGPREVLQRMTIAKQACDLQTATLAQRATVRLLETFDLDAHLARIRAVYRERCEAMLAGLARSMPDGTSWTRPEGGLFTWLKLPPGAADRDVFELAIARGVAVVPGSAFFVGAAEHGFLRLNYSNQPVDRIAAGTQRLAAAIRDAAG